LSTVIVAIIATSISLGPQTMPSAWAGGIGIGSFNHSLLGSALKRHVKSGRVDYAGMKSDVDVSKYLVQLDGAKAEALNSSDERLAFWINSDSVSPRL